MSSNLVQVNWETRKKVLFSNLNTLRSKQIHTDITLSCDGVNYPAHCLVLTMSSGYFAKAFETNRGHLSPSLVLICGIKAPILHALLNFIYDGTTTIKSEDIPNLLEAGLMLEIPGLMEMGNSYMTSSKSLKSVDPVETLEASRLSSLAKNKSRNRSSSQKESFLDEASEDNYTITEDMELETHRKVVKELEGALIQLSSDEDECNNKMGITISAEELLLSDSSDSEDKKSFEGWEGQEGETVKQFKMKGSTKGYKRSHRCQICGRSFFKEESLAEHMKNHNTPSAFVCDYCSKSFNNERNYNSHMNSHTVEGVDKKGGRSTKLKSNSAVKEIPEARNKHRKVEDDSTIDGVLNSVSQSFRGFLNGQRYFLNDDSTYNNDDDDDDDDSQVFVPREEEEERAKRGSVCDSDSGETYLTSLKEDLERQESVASTKMKNCRYCNLDFFNTESYRKHRTTDCKVLECPYCLDNFQSEEKDDYQKHVITHEVEDKTYTCPKCDFCTENKESFEDHVSLHTGIFRYWCPLCDFQARKLYLLRTHIMKKHPGIDANSVDSSLFN